jgi:hypothetical protein
MKTEKSKNVSELVHAAQIAGAADSASAEFWRDVGAHLEGHEQTRANLVKPRPLTEVPKLHTV